MHIQVSKEMFAALSASQLGYVMKLRGEVEIKVGLENAVMLSCLPIVGMTFGQFYSQ